LKNVGNQTVLLTSIVWFNKKIFFFHGPQKKEIIQVCNDIRNNQSNLKLFFIYLFIFYQPCNKF